MENIAPETKVADLTVGELSDLIEQGLRGLVDYAAVRFAEEQRKPIEFTFDPPRFSPELKERIISARQEQERREEYMATMNTIS